MTNADRDEFWKLLVGLGAAFREEVDEPMLQGYWLALSDLSLAALKKGATLAARTLKFMPKAAELRELSGDVSLSSRVVLAWDQVSRAIGTHGGNKSIHFDDPALNATIRAMGGWPELCDVTHADFHSHKQVQFEKFYRAFCLAGCTAEQGQYLVGRYERENRLHGYAVEPPVQFATALPPLAVPVRIERQTKTQAIGSTDTPKLELARP